jgi:hypothetical protein
MNCTTANVSYASHGAAWKATKILKRKNGHNGLTAYLCSCCKYFHIGRKYK